ncbi:type II toxin-antitoxin system VapC family toxin [soil metagenome]
MDIVVDTSVIIAVITDEAQKPRLVELTAAARLLAPLSVHWEIGNAFSAMLKRKRITAAQAQAAVAVYRIIPIRFVDVSLAESLALAERLGIYAYDAYLITCALDQKCPLLSLDGGLIYAARQAGAQVLEIKS